MINPSLLISGCTKGIGLAITQKFAAMGFNIAGCARNEKDLKKLFTTLSTAYPKQRFLMEVCDVANENAVKSFAQDAIDEFKFIDVLVNNAGIFLPGSILDEAAGTYDTLLHTNLSSAYHLSRAIAPHMVKRKTGHIFNMCSTASIQAYVNGGSYCISKFALLGLNNCLREELKDKRVKVTAVLPGATYTNSWKGSDIPKKRFMPAEDIAKMIWSAYELSDQTNVEEILIRPQEGDL